MKRFLQTERGNTFLHLLRKKQLATFAAILCLMALMPMTARAQGNVINTVFVSEELDKTSTVYVGEVVVDGVSEIKYLFSGDITLSNTLLQHLLDGLNGMADGDYASLLEEYKVNAYFYLPEERLALCSNPDLIALWTRTGAAHCMWERCIMPTNRSFLKSTPTCMTLTRASRRFLTQKPQKG